MAALLVPAAAIACYRRLSLLAAVVFTALVFLMVVVPMQDGSESLIQANFIGYCIR